MNCIPSAEHPEESLILAAYHGAIYSHRALRFMDKSCFQKAREMEHVPKTDFPRGTEYRV